MKSIVILSKPASLCSNEDKLVLADKLDGKIKYQDITYYKHDSAGSVDSEDNIHVDFLKAASEMESLDWTSYNYIGFANNKTNETLQFLRYSQDKWYADTLINGGKNWEGYSWGCDADTENVMATLRLFFEESSWFKTLNWTMRKHNPARDAPRHPRSA